MVNRLDGIRRSYLQLTERLADPDVLADSNLLMKVMKDRSESEEVVTNFEEVSSVLGVRCWVLGQETNLHHLNDHL